MTNEFYLFTTNNVKNSTAEGDLITNKLYHIVGKIDGY